jgi:hypothetical protein
MVALVELMSLLESRGTKEEEAGLPPLSFCRMVLVALYEAPVHASDCYGYEGEPGDWVDASHAISPVYCSC